MTVISEVITQLALEAFGNSIPRIAWSPFWWPNGTYILNFPASPDPLTFSAVEQQGNVPARWVAPLAGTTRRIDFPNQFEIQLVRADGSAETPSGLLLTLFPQLYLRLQRLYATALEPAGAPAALPLMPAGTRGISVRPVPRYFYYTTADMSINNGVKLDGTVAPGDELGRFTDLRVYDAEGMPIDPLAVFSCFNVLLHYFPTLLWLPDQTLRPTTANGLGAIAGANPVRRRVRLCDSQGRPIDGTNYTGLGNGNPATGLYPITGNAIAPPAPPAGTPDNRRLGSPHGGTLAQNFNPLAWVDYRNTAPNPIPGALPNPAAPAPALNLFQDFFTVRVVDMENFLLGTHDPNFTQVNNTVLERRPDLRFNEAIALLPTGNDVLAAANALLTPPAGGTIPNQSQCIAPDIDNTFTVPVGTGNAVLWPQFGSNPVNPFPFPPNPLPPNLDRLLTLQANYIADPATNQATPDVVLQLGNFPANLLGNTAIRVYARRWDAETGESRGDGAGAIATANPVTLLLKDPFRLRRPDGITDPPTDGAILHFDLIAVSNLIGPDAVPYARRYGNLNTAIALNAPVPAPVPAPVATTHFLDAPLPNATIYKGTCHSPLLDLAPLALPGVMPFLQTLAGMETGNTGNAAREAPRLPAMTCRDLIVSNRNGAVIAGGRLTGESLTAQVRFGCPGGPGGRETQTVGAAIQGGRLPYDLALLALRRSQSLPIALLDFSNAIWDLPAVGNGTFVGAVLQNLPPLVEMPGLFVLGNQMGDYLTQRATWDGSTANLTPYNAIFTWLNTKLTAIDASLQVAGQAVPVTQPLRNALTTNKTAIDNAAPTPARQTRIYQELERRLVSAVYGRRDTEWALGSAIARAQRFIYIETPGFTSTAFDSNGNPTPNDLWVKLALRMAQVPTLKVVVCLPKFPSFPLSLPSFIDYELKERSQRLQSLMGENFVVFHPIGFPGRPIQLETTLVTVDDTWALVGSSTFRRRGLSYDSSSDLVLTDTVYESGICPQIANFRQTIMANRLGLNPNDGQLPDPANNLIPLPNADFTRLYSGRQAFEVVREHLEQGGGRIEPLFVGSDNTPITEVQRRQANPDGAYVAQDSTLSNALWAELWAIEGLLI